MGIVVVVADEVREEWASVCLRAALRLGIDSYPSLADDDDDDDGRSNNLTSSTADSRADRSVFLLVS